MGSPPPPRLVIGTYPTPVERAAELSRPGAELWIKRDDLTHARYGGNKVRKLEHLLARAKANGVDRIVTVGAIGSHHVLATAVHAARFGIRVEAVLVPQPRTPHVVENVRADLALGVVPFPTRSWAMVPLLVAWRVLSGARYVPVGGSNVDGALGYVDAARELAEQVRAGELPEPDVVVVTLGSGGTAAGLAVGLAQAGLETRVLGVCVVDPAWAAVWTARRLVRACARRVDPKLRASASERFSVDLRYLGEGYGHATEEGARATREAARLSLPHGPLVLDVTYTAKTFAAALDLLATGAAPTVLYWHTLSSAPLAPLLEGAPVENDLPPKLRRLLLREPLSNGAAGLML